MKHGALKASGICLFAFACALAGATPGTPQVFRPIDGFTSPAATPAITRSGVSASSKFPDGLQLVAREHRGPVTALGQVPGTDSFFSAGKDGFLVLHGESGNDETWQVSDIPLSKIAVHPDGNRIAIYESDGFSVHRVSVWDWKKRTRLYAKRFRDSITSLSWSAKGTWLLAGNTSVDGLTILEADSGKPVKVFRNDPGIVTLAVTGASESSMITFGPSGRILYTDIASGSTKAAYDGEQDLDSPALLRNNLGIAGYHDGAMVLVDATSGKTISSQDSGLAVMATSITDREPVWFESTKASQWVLRSGASGTSPFSTPDSTPITSALRLSDRIAFGTASGKLCTIPAYAIGATAVPAPSLIMDQGIQSIDDIASDGSRLFILSKGSLFISSGPGSVPVFAFAGMQANRFAIAGDSLVFWSNDSANPVVASGFDGDDKRTLYETKEGIRSLNVSGSSPEGTKISLVEGTSKAVVIDIASGQTTFSYAGAGLQDAVLVDGNRLVVSRSSTSRAPAPVLLINIATEETVPLQIPGELCYGLKAIAPGGKKLAGFFIKDGTTASTELVSFALDSGLFAAVAVRTEASYADEDLGASLLVDGDLMLTNLGKGSIVAIGGLDKRTSKFQRGYALPVKSAAMDQFVVTLNHDGSLTWFDRKNPSILSSASITSEGFWLEE
jgi:hypothetical protein